jgi:hypothetical protein
MAKQIGLFKITGSFGGICFYRLDGIYYARAKSSLYGKRVRTDPAFKETMKYANRLGNASKIASALYREIVPKHERSRGKYREVVGMVMSELATMEASVGSNELNHRDTKTQRYTKANQRLHKYHEAECKHKKLSYKGARLSLSFTAVTACWCSCFTFWSNKSRSDTAGEKSAEYLASIHASSSIFNKRLSSSVLPGNASSTTIVQRRYPIRNILCFERGQIPFLLC